MKRKVISLIIWALLSVAFIWYLQDCGRRTGYEIQDYVEFYTEKYEKSADTSTEAIAKALTRNFINEEFYNIPEWFQKEGLYLGFVVVIYIGGTMMCYYFGNKKEKENKQPEQ